MHELKPLSREAIPAALEKAERYRLLGEPAEAESICLDVLRAEPENQRALVLLLLALTDRFGKSFAVGHTQAREILPRLRGEYERLYYAGVISERQGKAALQQGTPGFVAAAWLREAMALYEQAAALRPPGNDDALLRWNTCVRIVSENHLPETADEERTEMGLE